MHSMTINKTLTDKISVVGYTCTFLLKEISSKENFNVNVSIEFVLWTSVECS